MMLNYSKKKMLELINYKKFFNKIKLVKAEKLFFIVSLPRSGQTALINFLKKYSSSINQELKYCEHYSCCNAYPCKKGKNILKAHDFLNEVPIISKHKYIILIRRNYVDQMDSLFWYTKKLRHVCYEENEEYFLDFKKFFTMNKKYFYKFIKKWIKPRKYQIIYYDDLINKKKQLHEFKKFLSFLEIKIIDNDKITKSITDINLKTLEIKEKNLNFLKEKNFNFSL
jgi:hypothetical protein